MHPIPGRADISEVVPFESFGALEQVWVAHSAKTGIEGLMIKRKQSASICPAARRAIGTNGSVRR